MRIRIALMIAVAGLSLSACQSADVSNNLQRLDNAIASADIDPAVSRAIEGEIMVDPNLVGSSNANLVRTTEGPLQADYPLNGAPAAGGGGGGQGGPGGPASQTGNASGAVSGGATGGQSGGGGPAPAGGRRVIPGPDGPMTGACGRPFDYGVQWAQRMPADLPAYPGGNLTEAAGNTAGPCRVRVISFTTTDGWQNVIQWYRGVFQRTGFDAEQQQRQGAYVLGGTRGRDAYYLIVRPNSGGSEVDLIVNYGR